MTAADAARDLPDLTTLRDRARALAMLDAIISPEWESRYHSFDAGWADGEQMASMTNGSGDEYSIVFGRDWAYVRVFAHESELSPFGREDRSVWPGVLDGVPEELRHCVDEPAFSADEDGTAVPCVTACIWRTAGDDTWRTGDVDAGEFDDGAQDLLDLIIAGDPDSYQSFAEDYWELDLDIDAIWHVFELRPLTPEVVAALNPEVKLDELADDIAEIGYPTAG